MTDNEIIEALELCGSEYECHNGCPYYNNGQFKCRDLSIYRDALFLINRLQEKNSNLTSDLTSLQNDLISAKAEISSLNIDLQAMRGAANSYKAEIERLNSRKEVVVPSMRFIDGNPLNGFNLESHRFVARTVEDVKSEAYKECIEKIQNQIKNNNAISAEWLKEYLYNILKELVGENDA